MQAKPKSQQGECGIHRKRSNFHSKPQTVAKKPETTDYNFNGDITVYAPKPDGGNCGFPKFSSMTQKYFVALPKSGMINFIVIYKT